MARRTLWLDEALKQKDLSGKTYIVTGANSGVGLETTRQLVKQGAQVVMACRRKEAAEEAAATLSGLPGEAVIMSLDLAKLSSVRAFAAEVLSRFQRLDGLVANAGMVNMSGKKESTEDGLESTIAVSLFGHLLLTELLLDRLKENAPSRIVILSSVVHAGSPKSRPELDLDDLNYEKRPFNAFSIYAEAKLANVLYALELSDRLKGTGVTAVSVHPGWARSNFGSGGSFMMRTLMTVLKPFFRPMTDSNEASAQTSLHCLLADDIPEHSGAYYSQSSVLYRDKECKQGGWPLNSPNPHAHDLELAKRLVQKSKELVGLA